MTDKYIPPVDPFATNLTAPEKEVYKPSIDPFTNQIIKAEEEKEVEKDDVSYTADAFRSLMGFGDKVVDIPISVLNKVSEDINGKPLITERMRQMANLDALDVMSLPLEAVGVDTQPFIDKVLTPEGDIREPETIPGIGLEIAPIFVGAQRAQVSKRLKDLGIKSGATRAFIGGGLANQIINEKGDENFFNFLEDLVEVPVLEDAISFMAEKEEDPEIIRRLKLVGEEITLFGFGKLLESAVKADYKSFLSFDKPIESLSKTEKGEFFVKLLKEKKDKIQSGKATFFGKTNTKGDYFEESEFITRLREASEGNVKIQEIPKGSEQVARQQGANFSSLLTRLTGGLFTSRGYFSTRAYNAFEDSVYAQRQAIRQAENTANRLQKTIDDIVENNPQSDIKEKVSSIFEEGKFDFSFIPKGSSLENQVKAVSVAFDLPENVATELLQARNQIDELSRNLLNSPNIPKQFKEAISKGMNSYVRRSYRLYEDSNYTPSKDVRKRAREFLIKDFKQKNKKLTNEEATAQANNILDEIEQSKNITETGQYFSRVERINTQILQGRKDIPEELRNFMGEIKEPADNIILTVSKMAKFAETSRFFGVVKDLGESGGYIFDAKKVRPEGYDQIITGTNSTLDGMYTSKEMLSALKNQQGRINSLREYDTYRKFLNVQGRIQKYKTIYSHLTHMKNITGGAVMSLANGINPFSKESLQSFKVLHNSLSKKGGKELDKVYEKFLRLGIVNTNVTVNEFRDLITTGYKASTNGFKWLDGKPYGRGVNKKLVVPIEKGLNTIQDIYIATDDFYKINTYLHELDILKKANTGKPLEVLEAEAARITQNTYPNYDKVPPFIKSLRDFPFGSFVSFPAESIRVNINVIKQGFKEINSGNPALVQRGRARLSSLVATQSAVPAASFASGQLVFGGDEEKIKAAQILSEEPWSKATPRIFNQDQDGNVLYFDTVTHDPFSATKEPITTIIKDVLDGNIKEEDLDVRLLNLTKETVSRLAEPFISRTILADVLYDVGYALTDPEGRTRKGKEMFPKELEFSEKLSTFAYHALDKLGPGSLVSVMDLIDAQSEEPNKFTGKPKPKELEYLKFISSVNFKKLDVEDRILYSVMEYNKEANTLLSLGINYENTLEDIEKRYLAREKRRYKLEQELARKVQASITLVGKRKTVEYLLNADIPRKKIGTLISNIFIPNTLVGNKDIITAILEKTPFNKNSSEFRDFSSNISRAYTKMIGTPLLNVDDEKENIDEMRELQNLNTENFQRLGFNIGGEVSTVIPNAPIEPDERVNKLTGLPYNETAGTAYMDFDDPLRPLSMSKGGKVLRALKRKQA